MYTRRVKSKPLTAGPFFKANMEANQLFGRSNLKDWVGETSQLPSNSNRYLARAENVWGPTMNGWDKLQELMNAMPPIRNRPGTSKGLYPAEWCVLPLWLFNVIFGQVANVVGFSIKAIGDFLAYWSTYFLVEGFERLFAKQIRADDYRFRTIIRRIGILILQAPLWIPLAIMALVVFGPLWVIAQPIHLLSNMINYLRMLVDGITCSAIWLASCVTWFFGDKAKYPGLFYSLSVIAKSTLFLAPVALLIAFSIVPIAGQVSLFLGSVILNVGFTTIAGAVSCAVLFGLTVGLQAFSAAVNFVTPILWNMLPRILRARHSEIVVLPPHGTGKKEIHDALEQHPPRLPSNIQFGMVYGEPVAGTENKRYKCSVTYGTLYSHTLPLPKEIEVPKEYRYHPHLHTYCCAFLTGYIGAGLPKTTDKALNAGYAAGKSAGIQAREAQAEGAKRRADHHSDPSSRR